MRWAVAGFLFAGLILGGSEGAWWPWPNIAGLCALLVFAALVRRMEA
jgi:hypothetical protein